MAEKSSLKVLDLNFDSLKDGLKEFLRSRPEFFDYDFEGSNISLLLDLLAYNTYQNNYYTSMVANEMFLDSAQLRNNVVSRAKAIGYTPKSVTGSKITLRLTFTDVDVWRFSIPKDSLSFSASIDGITYYWTNYDAYEVVNSNGNHIVDVVLTEGQLLTYEWTVNTNENNQRYVIPNKEADTSILRVEVQNSSTDETIYRWTPADDIISITPQSRVYWLQEAEEERFELLFGDDVISRGLQNNNILRVTYRVASGDITNNISSFKGPSTINGYNYTAVTLSPSDGGTNLESIASIKFNAPKNYQVQNRAIASFDYERFIKQNFPFVGSLRVWGGETNDPPVYGVVFLSARPNVGYTLGSTQKERIQATLRKYNTITTDVRFIDPTFLYVSPQIKVIWDSTKTNYTSGEIQQKIINAITAYAENNFDTFEKSQIYHSRFVDVVDESDVSVLSNQTTFVLEKRFTPNFNNTTRYVIDYLNRLRATQPDNTPTLLSTDFTYKDQTCRIEDDSNGNIKIFYYDNSEKVYFPDTFGSIDYTTGRVILDSFGPKAAPEDEIRIRAIPYDLDVQSSKYQIMTLADYVIEMNDIAKLEIQKIVTVNTLNTVTYVRESLTGVII